MSIQYCVRMSIIAQLSAWQDYASKQLFIQQISIPLTVANNVRVLPGCTGTVSLALKLSKTSFVPSNMIIGKGITYVKPLDPTLSLRPVEIEFKNNNFEVLVNHKAIEYMIKSKMESPTTKLKTLLLKLSEYTIDLKYQKGSEMHTSDALSRL